MKSLYYISIPEFAHVDLAILPHLSKYFYITYVLIWPERNTNVNRRDIEEFCSKNTFTMIVFPLRRRFRDMRIATEFIPMLSHVRKAHPDTSKRNNLGGEPLD
jgi:hypothetical protein